MPRNLSSDMIAQLTAPVVRPAFFFEGLFGGVFLNLWSGIGDIFWNSSTWSGNGYLQLPSGGTETIQINSETMTIELMGVPEEIIAIIFRGNTGEKATLYFGFLDSSGAVVSDPFPHYVGLFDSAEILENSDQTSVSISYESRIADAQRVREFRYNKQSQNIFYPTDLGFDYVPKLQNWSGFWGSKTKPVKNKKKTPTRSRRPQ